MDGMPTTVSDTQKESALVVELSRFSFDETDSSLHPFIETVDAPDPELVDRKHDETSGFKAEQAKEILSDDSLDRSQERSGMVQRIRALGITPAWWKEKEEAKKRRELRSSQLDDSDSKAEVCHQAPLQIPFDIASCILERISDLETLRSCISVNKIFASCFEASRVSITRTVLNTMFNPKLVNHALMLATLIDRDDHYQDRTGKILLTYPDPFTRLSSPVLRAINMIYHTLGVWVELFETLPAWEYRRGDGKRPSRSHLGTSSRLRLKRGMLIYWVYSRCARNCREHELRFSNATDTFLEAKILANFSHVELLEGEQVMAFFGDILESYLNERGVRPFADWQNYCVSLGPIWFLIFLDRYEAGLRAAGKDRLDNGYFAMDLQQEKDNRGLGFAPTDVITQKGSKELRRWLRRRKMDGDAKPSAEDRRKWVEDANELW